MLKCCELLLSVAHPGRAVTNMGCDISKCMMVMVECQKFGQYYKYYAKILLLASHEARLFGRDGSRSCTKCH